VLPFLHPSPFDAVLTSSLPPFVQVVISSAQEFDDIYNNAASYRSTASTKLNAQSSRSHAVLSIEVKTEEVCEGGKSEWRFSLVLETLWPGQIEKIEAESHLLSGFAVLVGRINLVDLAGRFVSAPLPFLLRRSRC